MAIVREQKLLLIRRARAPEAGCWSLPGGKVELWERAEDAARRETAEELGIEVGTLAFLCIVELVAPGECEHWVSTAYLANDFKGEPRLLEPEKHTELGWFALDAMPEPLAHSAEGAAKALRSR